MKTFDFLQLAKERREPFDIIYLPYGGDIGGNLYIEDLQTYKNGSKEALIKFNIPYNITKKYFTDDGFVGLMIDVVRTDRFVGLLHEDTKIICKIDYFLKSDKSLEYILWCSVDGDQEILYGPPQTRFDLLDIQLQTRFDLLDI